MDWVGNGKQSGNSKFLTWTPENKLLK